MMADVPEGYTKPHFIMKTSDKNKLRMYLLANNLGTLSEYIANAVRTQMIKDGIIDEGEKDN